MSESHPTKEPAAARAVTVAEMTLYEVHVPLAEMAKARMDASPTGLGMAIPAEEPWDYGEFVICRLESDEGVVGWGESFVWLPETAVSAGQVIATVRDSLARYVLGVSPFDTRALAARMNRNVARNEVAKGLLDLACYDLAARSVGRPVYDLLGGRCVDALPLCALIPLGEIDETVAITSFFTSSGTNHRRREPLRCSRRSARWRLPEGIASHALGGDPPFDLGRENHRKMPRGQMADDLSRALRWRSFRGRDARTQRLSSCTASMAEGTHGPLARSTSRSSPRGRQTVTSMRPRRCGSSLRLIR